MVNSLKEFAEAIYNFGLSAVLLAALTGVLMHAIYAFGLRSRLQRTWVREWLWRRARFISENKRSKSTKDGSESESPSKKHQGSAYATKDFENAELDIVRLAGAGDERTLYSLSHRQLCGQISGAIRAELEYSSSPSLIDVFAWMAPESDREEIKEYLAHPEEYKDKDHYNDIRERILYHAERSVDDLQVFLHGHWDRISYLISISLAFTLILLLLLTSSRLQLGFREYLLYIAVGFAVGILAPVTQQFIETKLS